MDGASVAFSASSLLGPNGGLLGLAYAAGAASAWLFAMRTVYKMLTRERESCEKRVALLEEQVRSLNDKYTDLLERIGIERQMMQIRDSSRRVIHRKEGGDG